MSSDYRLAPALSARLVGLCLVVTAALVFALTLLAAALGWPALVIGLVAVVGLAVSFAVGRTLFRTPVVRLDDDGYAVRLVRGVGVPAAGWKEVETLATASPGGLPCLVLTLHDGRTTTIPAAAVDADREVFARDVRAHLERGQGLRQLGEP